MNKTNRDLAVYVLVRTDIPSMNPGKAMAQVHHAGVQMMRKYASHKLVKEYLDDGERSGALGFNTTITLAATINDITNVQFKVLGLGNICLGDQVVDPSYPFVVSKEAYNWTASKSKTPLSGIDIGNNQMLVTRIEITCAWFLGDRNDPDFKNLFEGLKLHE